MMDGTPHHVFLSKRRPVAEFGISGAKPKELIAEHRPIRSFESELDEELRLRSSDGMLR